MFCYLFLEKKTVHGWHSNGTGVVRAGGGLAAHLPCRAIDRAFHSVLTSFSGRPDLRSLAMLHCERASRGSSKSANGRAGRGCRCETTRGTTPHPRNLFDNYSSRLLDFTSLFRVSRFLFLPDSIELGSGVLWGFTGFYAVFHGTWLGNYWYFSDSTEHGEKVIFNAFLYFNNISRFLFIDLIEFGRVFTGFYWVSLGFIWFYWNLIGNYRLLLNSMSLIT